MMGEHEKAHEVRETSDLVPMFETLMAVFGYDAVRAAWTEASGDET